MPDHLPAFILKMLRQEQVTDRMTVANEIFVSLEDDIDDFGPIEKVMKKHFISRLKVCALHRNPESKSVINRLAQFYVKNYRDFSADFHAVA